MGQIVLINRYNPSSFCWSNLIKYNELNHLSVKQILCKYQGFEGELISLYTYDKEFLRKIDELKRECKNSGNCFLLYINSGDQPSPFFIMKNALKVGYDVGVFDEEKTIYSSIFNEIIFGNLKELNSCENLLNENLLFSYKSTAEKYVSLHNELSVQGKSVEDYEEMSIYEIWKFG